MSREMRRYVLLERDGVINRRLSAGYVKSWEDFEFLPRALDALRLLAENDYGALVVSNQGCVGKGLLSLRELQSMTRRFLLEVALAGGDIAKVYYCTHDPLDGCNCRKPEPGLLCRAMAEHAIRPMDTYVIAESESDMRAASKAGCRGFLLRREAFLTTAVRSEGGPETASNLYEAVEKIVRRISPTQASRLRALASSHRKGQARCSWFSCCG